MKMATLEYRKQATTQPAHMKNQSRLKVFIKQKYKLSSHTLFMCVRAFAHVRYFGEHWSKCYRAVIPKHIHSHLCLCWLAVFERKIFFAHFTRAAKPVAVPEKIYTNGHM